MFNRKPRLATYRLTSAIAVSLILLTTAGCANRKSGSTETSLAGTPWILRDFSENVLPEGLEITFTVTSDGRVSGSSGCNSFQGTCVVKGQSIRFGPLAGTKKMCMEPAGAMDAERQFLSALAEVTEYNVAGDTLLFLGPGNLELAFRKE